MTFQNIAAILIIVGAVAYVANLVWYKARSFSPKAGCANDCGCGSKSKDSLPIN